MKYSDTDCRQLLVAARRTGGQAGLGLPSFKSGFPRNQALAVSDAVAWQEWQIVQSPFDLRDLLPYFAPWRT